MPTTPRASRIIDNELRKMKPPCYLCNKRCENCHSVCPDYAEFKQQISAMKQKVIQTYETDRKLEDSKVKAKLRTIKKNSQKCRYI